MDTASLRAENTPSLIAPFVAPPAVSLPLSTQVTGQFSDPVLLHQPLPPSSRFMFATGIECSCPIVGQGTRVDQLDCCGHYLHWERDLQLVREMGIGHLRYGPPYYKMHCGPGAYDWTFFDQVYARMCALEIEPLVDLVHFGVPDWIASFQNPMFPQYLAEYALAFATRYPRIRYYTPVNEIYITAQFSGAFGWWNERLRSDRAFVNALANCCKGSLLAQQAILSVNPQAAFIHSESIEQVHAASPAAEGLARFMNQRKFLSLDLLYAHKPEAELCRYLSENGLPEAELDWFMGQRLRAHSILGTDYYITNERTIFANGASCRAGDAYGYYLLAKQYYERYLVPLMHTETNRVDHHSREWLRKQWLNVLRLREESVPIMGFTWYALTDQMDWDSALTHPRGHINTLGLYDLKRKPRAVAREYKRIITDYSHLLARIAPRVEA